MRRPSHSIAACYLIGIAFLIAGCGGEDPERAALAARLDSIVQAHFAAGEFHGGVLLARGEDIVYRGAFGDADLAAGIPNRPETRYPIHSITKSFTAIIVLQLAEEELLTLDGPIERYLPDYQGTASDRITLHHLLSHTSGVPDYIRAIPGYFSSEPPNLPRDSVLSLVGSMPLDFEPGEGFGYSNTGYVLLGKMIEEVTGNSFADALEKRIFGPLGMADSERMSVAMGQGIAVQHLDGGVAPVEFVLPGEGGIISTLDDMRRFAAALGSTELLSADKWELAFTPHADPADAIQFHPAQVSPHGYGFGLSEVSTSSGRILRVVQHGGQGLGGTAMMQRLIDGDGILLLWNNIDGLVPFMPDALQVLADSNP